MVGTQTTSLRSLARRLGVKEGAIRKAILTGRLERSIGRRKGRPMILDIALAEQEWRANRDPAKARNGRGGGTTAAARRRLIKAQAEKVEISNQMLRRDLIPREETQRLYCGYIQACKTKLLGLPTLAKQRLPRLTVGDVQVLNTLVREALESLADQEISR